MKANPINTRKGKRQFIRNLTRTISAATCAAVAQMPADWDGHEMRELLAEIFNDQRSNLMRTTPARLRKYARDRANIGRI